MAEKEAGLLFPISSLPSDYGVGDFGKQAYQLVDDLKDSGITLWQILPLNPLGYGNSPYQPLSSHAGDEIYISPDFLVEEKLLKKKEVQKFQATGNAVDYQKVKKEKEVLYKKAFSRFKETKDYLTYIKDNDWLEVYALFRVFKEENNEKSWIEWEDDYKYYLETSSFSLTPFQKEIQYHMFLQYCFHKQWMKLKAYANQNNIKIVGDMPIYVGLDSSDVWSHQESFLLEKDGEPSFVAGVPPDYFSKYGQRWGNPIYDWEYLEEHNFDFWVERMKAANNLYDIVRIDHFRAFDTYWKIPASEPTAVIGEWVEAPGYKLFDRLFHEIPDLSILAEDLGELREEVYHLRDHYDLRGMYVFQFHHHLDFDMSKVVVYSGTHDNETVVGWLNSLDENERNYVNELLEEDSYLGVIDYCMSLEAPAVIIPVWDIMGEDETCRFNVPGKIGSPNWEYRLDSFKHFEKQLKKYKTIIEKYI